MEKSMKIFVEVLKKRKYSNIHTSVALFEASALMRRRQAEALLGQVVNEELKSKINKFVRLLHPLV